MASFQIWTLLNSLTCFYYMYTMTPACSKIKFGRTVTNADPSLPWQCSHAENKIVSKCFNYNSDAHDNFGPIIVDKNSTLKNEAQKLEFTKIYTMSYTCEMFRWESITWLYICIAFLISNHWKRNHRENVPAAGDTG